ncbi:DJ-1/PfpI family protein [Salinibacillus xinjiangensis]|uniref:Peptidase n=1 Tax=Salinibacillus xinjiangensis TaxID=1229268 RepID=A0A6G1X2F7_9BACI|nr:DJ-1/PfpI family protein [Salinibacillus xinjiangensis]MRG85008.1 peptidase [Salinibacillus xinjiangensis]
MSKKVLLITGDAVEALEVYYPYFRLLEAGYEAVIASPEKKALNTVIHDFIGWDTYTERQGYLLESHVAFKDVDPTEYDGLVIPGGRAPEYIRLDENVPSIVNHFLESNKPVGAICHAVQVLSALQDKGYFEGKTMTAYTACKPDVENLGANYASETLHVDGKLVSGHAWPDLPGFMREFIKLIEE